MTNRGDATFREQDRDRAGSLWNPSVALSTPSSQCNKMKTSWTPAVVAIALMGQSAAANCVSACQSHLVHYREEACQKWRESLPRPDLFNHCGQGFNRGKSAGCEGFCKETPDIHVLQSLRLDACTSLKGVPPSERQQSCQAGFSAALDLAKDAADPKLDQPHGVQPHDAQPSSAQGSQADEEAGRKLEEVGGDTKRKVNVKKIIPEGERRNLLDEARREAEAAFVDAAPKIEL
ncbi:hypothetical protein V7S43_000291 [Phytophthora oleae]|uniref:Uncharacterized protein n=1 Tax=Phytophthora oleae TaxID=2107226 RepID=A0ABD3G8I2_9STRA